MSDFYQSGVISTLHRLGEHSLPRLESELKHYSRERPIALVLRRQGRTGAANS